MAIRTRRLAGAVLGGLVLAAATGCAGGATNSGNAPIKGNSPRLEARAAFPTPPKGTFPAPPSDAGAADCSGNRCTVVLSPSASAADALGTHLTLDGLQSNVARIGVGNERVRCNQGETVFAQPFSLTCTRIGGGEVSIALNRGN